MINILNMAILQGEKRYDFGDGAIVCIVAILLVFTVLLVIIAVTALISKLIDKYLKPKANVTPVVNNSTTNADNVAVDINDDDMMAAILVATIDFKNEVKEDVRVVNVRKVN